MIALPPVLVAVGWLLLLSFRQTRTLRTVLFLASLTAIDLVTYIVPGPFDLAVRVGLIVLAALVIVVFPWPIWYMSRADQEYDEFISSAASRLHRLDNADLTAPSVIEARLRDLDDAVHRLEERPPPDVAWERVRGRFLEHLRFDLDIYHGRLDGRADASEPAASWLAMRIAWSRARDSRSSFWR